MKPVSLTMHAFGPYAGKQELDFRQLQDRCFFLIHGPTGSGKTTILDAMCYALYGDTSGAVRDGKAMRSDHAAEDELTQVCFDFSIGSAIYRVERRPEQERPKKHGQGKTRVKPEATLWRLDDRQETVLAAGWEAVTHAAEQLLGFKSSQFRQVVLLPQGDFRRLLTANSAERQQIMQTLFKTELFQVIEEKLKSKANELKQQYDTASQEVQWVLKEASAASVQELELRLHTDSEQAAQLALALETADLAYKQAQERLTQGQLLQARFAEAAAAVQALQLLEEKLPQLDRLRDELAAGLKAAALSDAERSLAVLQADVATASADTNRLEQQLVLAGKRQAATATRLTEEAGREPVREEAIRQIQYLSELEGRVAQLQQSEAALAEARQAAEQAAATKQKTSLLLKTTQAELTASTGRYQQVQAIAIEVNTRRLAVEEAERRLSRRQILDAARHELAAAQLRAQQAAERLQTEDEQLQAGRQQLAVLQEAWENGQAALLAASLAAGDACPVCGSQHHPHKAQSQGPLPDGQLIKDKQVRLQQAEARRETLRQVCAKAERDRDVLAGRVDDLTQELQAAAGIPLTQLTAAVQQARERYQQAVSAERENQVLAVRLEELADAQKTATERLESLDNELRVAEGQFKAAETLVAERQAAVPPEYRQLATVRQAKQQAASRYQQLKTAVEQAQKEAEQANQAVAQLRAAQAAAQSALAVSSDRLTAAERHWAERVAAAGFVSMAEYRQAKRDPNRLTTLEQQISLFDKQLAAARERRQRAQAAVESQTPPDMDSLQSGLASGKAAYEAKLAEHTSLNERIRQSRQWLQRLQELQRILEQFEARYSSIGRLSEIANGRNDFGLTLQRFVLGALLDDVAIAANERLKTMSRGRYQLQRTMDRARRNAAGGLELEVFDNYTGAARPVTTLSGGETFLASLSLALGLADVVQSYAGGIHLDAIFVDEGFGTLDPETLEFALQALIALQQGGRLVGIISHVPELKDRIDARLEVSFSGKGSAAAFIVN